MNLQRLNATMEYDQIYGNTLLLDDTLIHSEDWDKIYEQYKIIKSNYEKDECDEIKNRAAKLIQSWWFQSNGIL